MPRDLVKRIDLDLLEPTFCLLALDVIANCRQRGASYWAISGYRSPEEQAALYFQGRTMPGKIVTGASAYNSAHNYGIAMDLALDKDTEREGLQPDYRREAYAILGEETKKAGLVWGGDFKSSFDGPHIQLPGYVTGSEISRLKVIALSKNDRKEPAVRLRRVWDFIGKERASC